MRRKPLFAFFLLLFLAFQASFAQSIGSQPEAGASSETQAQFQVTTIPQKLTIVSPKGQKMRELLSHRPAPSVTLQAWGKSMAPKWHPTQPHRPIPAILIVLGLGMMIVWAALLVGTILTDATLGLILLISTIVLSPLVILGLLLVIGGFVAATSGGKKQATAPSGS